MIPAPRHPRRLVYLATPALAVPPLRALVAAGYEVALVVSGADKRRGRGAALSPSPVKATAVELGIPVTTDVDEALGIGADLGVVVAFGRMIKAHVLDRLAMVNIHFSLLPRWRGAAPVERAILAGDERTGACVMEVDEGLDEGGVYAAVEVAIGAHETAESLRARLVDEGTTLLLSTLAAGLGSPEPQRGEVVYAAKITPADLRLDWSQPAAMVDRVVRVGGAWTTFRGQRLKVCAASVRDHHGLKAGELDGTRVGCGSGALELVEVQPEGKARQDASAWLNGARIHPDDRLGA